MDISELVEHIETEIDRLGQIPTVRDLYEQGYQSGTITGLREALKIVNRHQLAAKHNQMLAELIDDLQTQRYFPEDLGDLRERLLALLA